MQPIECRSRGMKVAEFTFDSNGLQASFVSNRQVNVSIQANTADGRALRVSRAKVRFFCELRRGLHAGPVPFFSS